MIRIIVSHDVDHLYGKDHWFRDFVYPKLWVRSTIQLLKHDISLNEWFLRNCSCFKKKRNHIQELMAYDKAHGIKSTFFFGMNQGLGMSYKPYEARDVIRQVCDNGFVVGVHGIDYQSNSGITDEYNAFYETMGFYPAGIRMHYVRHDNDTFSKLASVGYSFDSTEFNKREYGTRKNPYKIGNMWEFPLTIMDGYLPQRFEEAKQKTLDYLEECQERRIDYISVLFHDYQFYDGYKDIRDWYIWLMEYFENSEEYEFISYPEAVDQLEMQNGRNLT